MTLTLLIVSALLAGTPSDNTIPTLAMRIRGPYVYFDDITLELLCELSWLYFDAVNFDGRASNDNFDLLMSRCDSAGVYYSICPSEIMQYLKEWGDSDYRYWFRNSDSLLTSNHCFAQSDTDFVSILNYTTADIMYNADTAFSISTTIEGLAASTRNHDFLWYYEVYDESTSKQWRHTVEDTLPWNDYIPNVYTDSLLNDSIPTFVEVEASGLFSIQKYYAEHDTLNAVTFTLNYGLLHTIESDDYTGFGGQEFGDFSDQATSIESMMEAMYLPPPDSFSIPELVANSPRFISFDYYPFRYVDSDYDSTTAMCDEDWLFLVEHLEDAIDSTIIPAHEYDVPVYFMPQTFGAAGGPLMYDSSGNIDYPSYRYRNPAPQEFRMLCNLALMHQAKGIFPYNLCSYIKNPGDLSDSTNLSYSSLLDMHEIPFDAPYEEWVYTGRWPEDTLKYEYIRPDSLPPWIDGYDPLYEADNYPPLEAGDPKQDELIYEWLFAPYGILYNEVGGILADVKTIGPELHDLWWCGGDTCNAADIEWDPPIEPDDIQPVIKLFEDEAQEACYLYYVDRHCISNGNTYEITYSASDLPEHADCSVWLLDHSRRFIMKGTADTSQTITYTFLDTLDAGEGRLVQLIDPSGGLSADVRVTSPDVGILDGVKVSSLLEATVGDSVELAVNFYNMGTDSIDTVYVTLYDSTVSDTIGLDTLEFDGLIFRPPSPCMICDSSTAYFSWVPVPSDIGVHRLTVAADSWPGEPVSTDNSVDFTFLVNPRDYATYIREDAWDMTEGGHNAWNTPDIEAVDGGWDTAKGWTDSVSGMFEGIVDYDTSSGYLLGDISLAIPNDSTEYIDTDMYRMLSFGIVGNNPNQPTLGACAMYIKWIDSNDDTLGWCELLNDSNYSVCSIGNGWDEWGTVGPIDLSGISGLGWDSTGAAKELWIRFKAGVPIPFDPFDIRIGWIRLEESAQ